MGGDSCQRIEDQFAIRELVARYNYAIDEGRPEEWVTTFVPDGTFESSALGTHTGAEALLAFAKGYISAVSGRHCTSDFVIEVDGDAARSRCYLIAVNNAAAPSSRRRPYTKTSCAAPPTVGDSCTARSRPIPPSTDPGPWVGGPHSPKLLAPEIAW
jgi:hypothetical protein